MIQTLVFFLDTSMRYDLKKPQYHEVKMWTLRLRVFRRLNLV